VSLKLDFQLPAMFPHAAGAKSFLFEKRQNATAEPLIHPATNGKS
jgi:hypothetical protein